MAAESPKQHVSFHYVKSPQFRTVHADGFYGGVSPNGSIFVSAWNERWPIPQLIEVELVGSALGEETRREGREGVVRELEVGFVITPTTARALRDFLDKVLDGPASTRPPEG